MRVRSHAVCLFMALAATAAAGQGLLLQEPTLGKTHIVFVYAGACGACRAPAARRAAARSAQV